MGIFFLKNGGQNVTEIDLAFFRGPGMVDGPLNHALKTDGLLENIFFLGVNLGEFFIKKLFQFLFDLLRVSPAFLYGIRTGFMVQDRVKNMLYTDIFVPSFFGFPYGKPEGSAQFLAYHTRFTPFPWCFSKEIPGWWPGDGPSQLWFQRFLWDKYHTLRFLYNVY